jgi:nucleolar protein 53
LTSKPIVPSDLQSKAKISSADKERLRRIARKGHVGLDGSGLGSAVVSKLKDDPLRDVWTERQTELERLARVKGSWTEVVETARLPNVPSSIQLQRQLQSLTSQTDAVPIPDAGTSYNPQLESHQALIDAAVHEEEARLKREAEAEAKVARYKKIIENRRENLKAGFDTPGGMTIAAGDSQALIDEMETEIEDVELESPSALKVTKRKTQADRNKAKRQAEEVCRHAGGSLGGRLVDQLSLSTTASASCPSLFNQSAKEIHGLLARYSGLHRLNAVTA